MSEEWYYTTSGEQTEARLVPGLLPTKGPPALPKRTPPPPVSSSPDTALTKPSTAGTATFDLILDPFTGDPSGNDCPDVHVYFDQWKYIGIKLRDGLRFTFPRQVATGLHRIKIVPLVPPGAGKKLLKTLFGAAPATEDARGERLYRVEFAASGHYTVRFRFDDPRSDDDFPTGVVVAQDDATVQEVGPGVVAKKAISAIGGWWKNMGEESRRAQLHGVWEAVDGQGAWFLFTGDGGMLRADGFGAKYRWVDDETVEVYENGIEATARFQVLSLGKHELLLKAAGQTGHYKRGVSITESEEVRLREEARVRAAETRQQVMGVAGTIAAVLAGGGLAVLCGAAAAASAGGGAAGGSRSSDSDDRGFEKSAASIATAKGGGGSATRSVVPGAGGTESNA